jgi:trans-aconitate methyltransferase
MDSVIHPADPMRDWSAYNAAQAARARPRELLGPALAAAGTAQGRVAVEIGCGAGIEALEMARAGWSVRTYDRDPSVVPLIAEIGRRWPVVHTQVDIVALKTLPQAGLIFSSAALPYIARSGFPALWQLLVSALLPGGVLAVDLFGDRDEWSSGPGTYLTRAEVECLASGLETLRLDEEEYDGPAFSGPKHWHLFTLIARRPA